MRVMGRERDEGDGEVRVMGREIGEEGVGEGER